MSEDRPYVPLDNFTNPRDHTSRVVPLWVNGRPPFDLSVSEHTLAFGGQLVNSPSSPLVLILTNTGFKSLFLETITIEGSEFTMADFTARELEPNKIYAIPVTYTPTEFGTDSGVLRITTTEGITKQVRLIGTGIWDYIDQVGNAIERLWAFLQRATRPALTTDGPIIDLSNTAVEFSTELPVGSDSEVFDYVISNAGNETLYIDNIQVSGEFELVT